MISKISRYILEVPNNAGDRNIHHPLRFYCTNQAADSRVGCHGTRVIARQLGFHVIRHGLWQPIRDRNFNHWCYYEIMIITWESRKSPPPGNNYKLIVGTTFTISASCLHLLYFPADSRELCHIARELHGMLPLHSNPKKQGRRKMAPMPSVGQGLSLCADQSSPFSPIHT